MLETDKGGVPWAIALDLLLNMPQTKYRDIKTIKEKNIYHNTNTRIH